MKKRKYLVIHCTATPEGREVTSDEIRRWHTGPKSKGGRGWKQVGYTDMIHLDGREEPLIPNNNDAYVDGSEISNGAFGINAISKHVVYVGGMDKITKKSKNTLNEKQSATLKNRIFKELLIQPDVLIIGHNQANSTSCPGFSVSEYLKSIGVPAKNIVKGRIPEFSH